LRLTGLVLLIVLLLTLALLLLAHPIHRILGQTGESVLVRVMGLVLSSLAAEQIVTAIELLRSGAA